MNVDRASRAALLRLARDAIALELGGVTPDGVDAPTPLLGERRGAFVSLYRAGRLRGCIGRIEPTAPLRLLVPEVARSAAFADPRFPPVREDELASLVIEISLLSALSDAVDPGEVVVGRHGVVVAARGRRGLLLPQVAREHGWSREELLAHACGKAGLARGAWRTDGVVIRTFTADVFSEAEEERTSPR
jgi:AmmeMemoRadiSam system protein A